MALLTTRRIKLVAKKEFTTVTFDPEYETYVVHVGSVSSIASPSFSPLKTFATATLDLEYKTYVVYVRLDFQTFQAY